MRCRTNLGLHCYKPPLDRPSSVLMQIEQLEISEHNIPEISIVNKIDCCYCCTSTGLKRKSLPRGLGDQPIGGTTLHNSLHKSVFCTIFWTTIPWVTREFACATIVAIQFDWTWIIQMVGILGWKTIFQNNTEPLKLLLVYRVNYKNWNHCTAPSVFH